MNEDFLSFPARLYSLNKYIVINTPEPLGVMARVTLHEIARKMPLYKTPINCPAQGKDKSGKTIKIDTLGRWLFGVPGYIEHIRILQQNDSIVIYYPEGSPDLVEKFLNEFKITAEQKMSGKAHIL